MNVCNFDFCSGSAEAVTEIKDIRNIIRHPRRPPVTNQLWLNKQRSCPQIITLDQGRF